MSGSNAAQISSEGGKNTFSYIELGKKTPEQVVEILAGLNSAEYGMIELRKTGEEDSSFSIMAVDSTNPVAVIHTLGAEFEETINFEDVDNLRDLVYEVENNNHYEGARFLVKIDDMNAKQIHVFRVTEEKQERGEGAKSVVETILAAAEGE